MTEDLVRIGTAAKALGLKRVTFVHRNYPIARVIDGVKYYDLEQLLTMPFLDKRFKNNRVAK